MSFLQKNILAAWMFCLMILFSGVTLFAEEATADEPENPNPLTAAEKKDMQSRVRPTGIGYWEFKTKYYDLTCGGSQEYAYQCGKCLDIFYERFVSIFNTKWRSPGRPEVYVGADRDAYVKKATAIGMEAADRTDGVFAWAGFMVGSTLKYNFRILAFYARQKNFYNDQEALRVMQHEGTHQLMQMAMGEYMVPRWYNEGSATNFETFDFDWDVSQNLSLGFYNSRYWPYVVEEARGGFDFNPNIVFNCGETSWFSGKSDKEVILLYSNAWSMVNYLLSKKGQVIYMQIWGLIGQDKGKDLSQATDKCLQTLQDGWIEDFTRKLVDYQILRQPEYQKEEARLYAYALLASDVNYCKGIRTKAMILANALAIQKFKNPEEVLPWVTANYKYLYEKENRVLLNDEAKTMDVPGKLLPFFSKEQKAGWSALSAEDQKKQLKEVETAALIAFEKKLAQKYITNDATWMRVPLLQRKQWFFLPKVDRTKFLKAAAAGTKTYDSEPLSFVPPPLLDPCQPQTSAKTTEEKSAKSE